MQPNTPILGELVLIGGGHAQVAALKQFAMRPLPGLRLTLITKDIRTPYSGMLPGYVEGVWDDDDLHIDLAKLAQMADARLIHDSVTGIDFTSKQVTFAGRPPLRFDILSINIGGQPDLDSIPGARQYAIPVKPISTFQHRLDALLTTNRPKRIAVIGGGAAGCELALALSKRWLAESGARPDLALFGRASTLMPAMAPKAANVMAKDLAKIGAKIILGHAVMAISADNLTLDNGDIHEFDACFLVSAVRPPSWLAETGLTLADDGFIAISDTLQAVDHPFVFASGDIATIETAPRPKAGVFAVRAGPHLGHNIRQLARGQRLRRWKPQSRYLAIIGTSDGKAIAARGEMAHKSWLWWQLKCWIDRNWMAKYQNLSMDQPDEGPALAGINKDASAAANDPVFDPMRCLGCGAKTGHGTLSAAMDDAVAVALKLGGDPAYMPDPGLGEDSAIIPAISGKTVQSVDILSQIVSDPFEFGHIAAIHALSDLYAANATPTTALAILNLSQARIDLQQDQLTQILAGALLALSDAKVKLIGGHTSEGDTLSAGFAVTGVLAGDPVPLTMHDDYALILTKPLGSGVIMAGHMQLEARADSINAAISEMKRSNAAAAAIIHNKAGHCWITDVTGFGLARHAQNLIERAGAKGAHLSLSAIPTLPGAVSLLDRGIKSSLHDQNRAAVRVNSLPKDDILYDPQTSGGLLAIVPHAAAALICDALNVSGHKSAIIGVVDQEKTGLTLTPNNAQTNAPNNNDQPKPNASDRLHSDTKNSKSEKSKEDNI